MSNSKHDAQEVPQRGTISLLASGLRKGFLDAYTGDSVKAFFLFHIRVATLLILLIVAVVTIISAVVATWQAASNGYESSEDTAWAEAEGAWVADTGSAAATAEAAAATAEAAAAAAGEAAAAAMSAGTPTGSRFRIIEPAPPPSCQDGAADCEPWERDWNTDQ